MPKVWIVIRDGHIVAAFDNRASAELAADTWIRNRRAAGQNADYRINQQFIWNSLSAFQEYEGIDR